MSFIHLPGLAGEEAADGPHGEVDGAHHQKIAGVHLELGTKAFHHQNIEIY